MKRKRKFQKNVRTGIIVAMIVGIASVIKALSDGANQTGPWAGIAFLSLSGSLLAMFITRAFGGDAYVSADEKEELLVDEPDWSTGERGANLYGQTRISTQDDPIAGDPLINDDLNPDEIRHLKAMRQKAKRRKNDILNTDVTGIAFVLFGIPALLVIAFVAFMMTIMDGGGFGTFLAIFLVLGILGVLKVIKG